MKHIGLLLHFYQPPTQDPAVVTRIDRECYYPLFSLLEETGAPVTVNINLSLTEQLKALAPRTLETISRLSNCSFTHSGAYHPILPLIPPDEARRQLKLNSALNRKLIGGVYAPQGVFPPEMAVSMETIRLMGSMGYGWTITDDIPWVAGHGDAPCTWIPSVDGTAVLLRSNFWSNLISFHGEDGKAMAEKMAKDLHRWSGDEDSYLVIAMDGETFGHHRPGGVERFLLPFLKRLSTLDGMRLSSLDSIGSSFPLRESEVPSGSWSTAFEDVKAGEPYPLWSHSGNRNHRAYLKLMNYVLENTTLKHVDGVADKTDKMLYSCPLWWASPGRESGSQVRRGILMIIEAALEGLPRGEFQDRMMELAGEIPAMAGRDR